MCEKALTKEQIVDYAGMVVSLNYKCMPVRRLV